MPVLKDPKTGKFAKNPANKGKPPPRKVERRGEVSSALRYKRLLREAIVGRNEKDFKRIARKLRDLAIKGDLEAIKVVLLYVIGKPSVAITGIELAVESKEDPAVKYLMTPQGSADFYIAVIQSPETDLVSKLKARRELDVLLGNVKDGSLGDAEKVAEEAREFFMAAMQFGVPARGGNGEVPLALPGDRN